MTRPPRDTCRLIAEAGLAAVNHGLYREAESIRAALPWLVGDSGVRRILEASLLVGLGQPEAAMALLEGATSAEAAVLRRLVLGDAMPDMPRT